MKRRDLLTELRGLSVEGLQERVRSMKEESMKLRFRLATGQLDKPHRLGILRRDVARVETIIRQAVLPGLLRSNPGLLRSNPGLLRNTIP